MPNVHKLCKTNTSSAIRCPILALTDTTAKAFVDFWHPLARSSTAGERFYYDNIDKELTHARILEWFRWKNGMRLSARKQEIVECYFKPEERIASDMDYDSLLAYLIQPGGVIWRTFWLHLHHPKHYPIYDQHAYRAMAFMLRLPKDERELPDDRQGKASTYLEFYRPFFAQFAAAYGNPCDHRRLDQALWRFGMFLKSKYAPLLTD
jgi:hypothetical protein